MTNCRYPPQLDEHEDGFLRLDDHLTDEERRRLKWIIGVKDTQRHGRPYIRSALGAIGIVVMVLGAAAVIYGARGESVICTVGDALAGKCNPAQAGEGFAARGTVTPMSTTGTITTAGHIARCGAGWTLVMQANGRPGCAWVVKDAE